MNRSHQFFALILCLFVFTTSAGAWWDAGHMTVAYVAYQKLKCATRMRIAELLKRNPYYDKWVAAIPAGTSEADKQMMLFMIASTWPDQIKTDPDYAQEDGPAGGNRPPAGPEASQNIGYQDHRRHKYWHFIDVPFTQDGTPLEDTPTPNAATQMSIFRKAIASDASDDVKSYDVVWLLHLVGDVHQPLHSVGRFTKDDPHGDNGGNNVKLCAPPCKEELHGFWDGQMGDSKDPAAAIQKGRLLKSANKKKAQENDIDLWIKESSSLAQAKVYSGPIGNGDGPFTITPEYRKMALRIASQRVALAGARLANLLNQELK